MNRAYLFACCIFVAACGGAGQQAKHEAIPLSIAKERKNCWTEGNAPTLLSIMQQVMGTPLEKDFQRDNFIQTFGCAYEEVDIEKNAGQAVYRAILQSLHNRNVTARDDLQALLRSRPPRPDNLVRDFTIYVNMQTDTGADTVATYEIKILQLEMVPTVESPTTIWTRVASRFKHRKDHFQALPVSEERSAFAKVIRKAEDILTFAEQGHLDHIQQVLATIEAEDVLPPRRLEDLVFGDRVTMRDRLNPRRDYVAVYLGKGLLIGDTPEKKAIVFKFGEERQFGLRMDLHSLKRVSSEFVAFNYRAPETILQCLFLKSRQKQTEPLISTK